MAGARYPFTVYKEAEPHEPLPWPVPFPAVYERLTGRGQL